MFRETQISQLLSSLEQHLSRENPVLEDVVESFRQLDRVSRRLGFFHREQSHATRAAWWPLISVLGTYSSGKSTFINYYLRYGLQATGNQAVDDKFTVICFSGEDGVRVLPGLALDADPRFPLYKISQALDEVAPGQGQRVDAYLQLKSCPSEKLRGKILIDSPGFDADAQRTSILRITDHIVDLSDLVLVLFDARHPESGSMPETLEHLVKDTIHRRDSNKFLYILNQIDATAQEDNPEQVFAAWQRAVAQHGLTAGRFYSIYNPDVALPIENADLRKRFESKRDADLAEIYNRIDQVRVERAYRIVGMLEQTAQTLERDVVTRIREFIASWRRWVLRLEGGIVLLLLVLFVVLSVWAGYWDGLRLRFPPLERLMTSRVEVKFGVLAALLVAAGYVHFSLRRWAADRVMARMLSKIKDPDTQTNFARAFRKNSRWWRTMFRRNPVGWGRRALRSLAGITDEVKAYIQKLNDEYTNPSGDAVPPRGEAGEKKTEQGGSLPILGVVEDAPEGPEEEAAGTGDVRG